MDCVRNGRARLAIAAGLLASLVAATAAGARQDEPDGVGRLGLRDPASQRAITFLEGLRERGYHDLAGEYIEKLQAEPSTPAELKPVLAFEAGSGLLEEAETAPDLDRRDLLLDRARVALDGFLKANPDHPLAAEAKVRLAQLLYQRGQTLTLKADEATDETAKQARLTEARGAFEEARKAYDVAIAGLEAAFNEFPTGFLEEGSPERVARDEAQGRMIDALLKRALVDYDEAQTYPEGTGERNKLLDEAIAQFTSIHDDYRTWISGFAARMWQAKSLEEKGELGPALGIYNELLGHEDPRLRGMQRQVAFFKIITHRKREEYPLAERLAREWLTISRGDSGSYERLGVQLELAKDIDAMLEAKYEPALSRRDELVRDLVNQLTEVVRYASPYKPDAVGLLTKYRPTGAIDRRELARLGFDQTMERGREAMAIQSFDNAIALFRSATTKVDPARETDRLNEARYFLAFSLYRAGRFHEAAVIADFLARRYPDWDSSLPATELGMSSLALAYEDEPGPGKAADLKRLEDLAAYTTTAWPDAPQADVARILQGDIALGQGRYDEAAAAYESVKTPAHMLDARSKAAAAHWRRSLALRKDADSNAVPPEAAAEAKKALDLLKEAYDARLEARVPPTDPGRIGNAADLAEIHLSEDRPDEALKLMEPHIAALTGPALNDATRPLLARMLKLRLRGHIDAGQTDAAIGDMKALEQASTGESLTQLFFGLGRLLEDEMEAQRAAGNRAALEQTRKTFQEFLEALISSETGQSFESLEWAGEQMLTLERYDRAAEIFNRVLKDFADNERIARTKLMLSSALRGGKKFREAWSVTTKLIEANPRALDFLMEQCQILEDWAAVEPGYWNVAIDYWSKLAKKLQAARPRPPEYYDCWYHVAYCQYRKGNKDAARKTIESVRALSQALGTPEIKQKYEELAGRVGLANRGASR